MDALPRAPLLKSFAKQMLDGAEYLHKNGIVHRASRLISCSRSSRKAFVLHQDIKCDNYALAWQLDRDF